MIFKSSQPAANEQKLQTMIGQFIVYPFDQTAARQFGRVVTELRRIGRPIPPIDMQIAAIALANDLILLTADRHFDHVAGLKHENWI